jgi:hypothetical protein
MNNNYNNNNEPIEESYFQLQDFVPDPKRPFPTILLVGKRMSGKSNASVAIAEMYNMCRWAAWCGTKDTEDFWADRFGSKASVFAPDDKGISKLLELLQYQERKIRLYKRIIKKPLPDRYSIGLVFDDVTAKRKFRKGEILEDLFSNGRHYHAVIIISCQYIKQLPPAVRGNTDYLFMLHNTKRTCKILHEEYVNNPEDYSMFLDLLRVVTSEKYENGNDKYNALVFNNCTKSENLEVVFQIFHTRPDFDPENVHLGSAEWRAFNNETYVDKDLENDVKEYRKHKRELRLERYKLQRQQKPSGLMDADYFSDSDSNYDSEDDTNGSKNTHRIQNKKGSVAFNIKLGDTKTPQTFVSPFQTPQNNYTPRTPFQNPQLQNPFQTQQHHYTPLQPSHFPSSQNSQLQTPFQQTHFQTPRLQTPFQPSYGPQNFNILQTPFQPSYVPQNNFNRQTSFQPSRTPQNSHIPQTPFQPSKTPQNSYVSQTPFQPSQTTQNSYVPQNNFTRQTSFQPSQTPQNNFTRQTSFQPYQTPQNSYIPQTSFQPSQSPQNSYMPQTPFQPSQSPQNSYMPQTPFQPSYVSQNNFTPIQPSQTPQNNYSQTSPFQTPQNNYVRQTPFQPYSTPQNNYSQTSPFQTPQNNYVRQTPFQPYSTPQNNSNRCNPYQSQKFNNFSRPSMVF